MPALPHLKSCWLLLTPPLLPDHSRCEVEEGVGRLTSDVVTWGGGEGEDVSTDEGESPLAGAWLMVLGKPTLLSR